MATEKLRVGDIMTSPAWTLQVTDPVRKAQNLLLDRKIRRLPVLEGERLVGMLSDRDLLPCSVDIPAPPHTRESERAIEGIHVIQVMQPTPISIGPYHTVSEAARIMLENRAGALPVVEQHRVIGIVTQTDVLRALLGYSSLPAARRPPKQV